jgi:hypothetical protein
MRHRWMKVNRKHFVCQRCYWEKRLIPFRLAYYEKTTRRGKVVKYRAPQCELTKADHA